MLAVVFAWILNYFWATFVRNTVLTYKLQNKK